MSSENHFQSGGFISNRVTEGTLKMKVTKTHVAPRDDLLISELPLAPVDLVVQFLHQEEY